MPETIYSKTGADNAFAKKDLSDPETQEILGSGYVQFKDQDGNPLPPGSVTTIVVNTTTGEIDDIIFQEA